MKTTLKVFLIVFIGVMLISYFSAFADPEKAELIFSHKLHVEENGLECNSCHEPAESSTTGKDNLMPAMETCGNCHDVESDDNCGLCHIDTENPMAVPRVVKYSPLFSHQRHLAAGFTCESCHSEVIQKTEVDSYILPDMESCMKCHHTQKVSNECSVCHLANDRLKPVTHAGNFLHEHGNQARTQSKEMIQTCNVCHSDRFCQKCHEGDNLDRTSHPLNYAFTHSLDAQGKERECAVCHTERSFCNDCHSDFQILPHNHTAGWVNNIPNDGGRHRIEAQNDLENCMSCHEQNAQQVCQTCHSK